MMASNNKYEQGLAFYASLTSGRRDQTEENATEKRMWEMRQRLRGCTCKVGYATLEIAQKQAQFLNRAPNGRKAIAAGKNPAEGYMCKVCRLFHVGHPLLTV